MVFFWILVGLILYAAVGFLCCLIAPAAVKWYYNGKAQLEENDEYMIAIFWPIWLVCAIFVVPFEIAVRMARDMNKKMNKE